MIRGGVKNDPRSELAALCKTVLEGRGGATDHAREIQDRMKREDEAGIPYYLPDMHPTAYRGRLEAHLASAPGLDRHGHQQSVTEEWRGSISFNFDGCTHTEQSIIEVKNEYGIWGLAVCVRCAYVDVVECAHAKNEWYLDGRVLVCLNCGTDGT